MKKKNTNTIISPKKKKKGTCMKSILNRIHTSSEKERGEGKKRRYPSVPSREKPSNPSS